MIVSPALKLTVCIGRPPKSRGTASYQNLMNVAAAAFGWLTPRALKRPECDPSVPMLRPFVAAAQIWHTNCTQSANGRGCGPSVGCCPHDAGRSRHESGRRSRARENDTVKFGETLR